MLPIHDYIEINPNPVISRANIRYELKESCDVDISIYNCHDQLLETLDAGCKENGIYELSWDCNDIPECILPCGKYYLRFTRNNASVDYTIYLLRDEMDYVQEELYY